MPTKSSRRAGGGGGSFGGGGTSNSWDKDDNIQSPTIESQAQEVIRSFLPDDVPENVRNKSFYEIAKCEDQNGNNIGVSAIGDAWNEAVKYIMSQSPAFDPELRKILLDLSSLSAGSGTFGNQIQNFMIGFDKYGKSMLMPNIEMPGLTFFTRPRLCLQSSNLRNNPVMMPLDTSNPNSIAFAIRYLLDTNLCNTSSRNYIKYLKAAENSPLINDESPWLIPLTNALTSFGGLPSFDLTTENTTGGYFSESQSYAIGSDNFSTGSYNVTCDFREVPGSIIFALFFYWIEYIRCVVRGDMLAYPDDIDGQIMNYTISIYSFNMDPSMQYITRWVKCTGCFPKSLNIGDTFTKNINDSSIRNAQNVSINFMCNKIEYMKPECLLDFNTLAARYCPDINSLLKGGAVETDINNGQTPKGMARPAIPDSPFANFCGLPFIVSDPNGYRLLFRESKKDLYANPIVRKLIACDVARLEQEWAVPGGESNYTLYQKYDYNDFYENDVNAVKNGSADGSVKINPFSFDNIVKSIQDGTFAKEMTEFNKNNPSIMNQ